MKIKKPRELTIKSHILLICYYLHKTTTEIVKNHDIISVEDLAVGNIMKNRHLAQAMSDVSLGTFYTMLEYKAAWNDRTFIKIDRFFPSSKTCSCCGWKKEDLTLRDRVWTCPSCDTLHERDVNAARNILKQGLIIQSGCGSQSDLKQKRDEGAPLGESMNPEALTKATAQVSRNTYIYLVMALDLIRLIYTNDNNP